MGKDLNGKELGVGIRQRKDGRYEARTMIDGVQIDVYALTLNTLKKEFEKEKRRVLREERNVRLGTTLEEWYAEWFEKCKAPTLKNEASRSSYNRVAANTYIRLLGDKKISSIGQINIQMATNQLIEEGRTYKSIRDGLGVLRACMESALANRLIMANPCVDINLRNDNQKKERRVLSTNEQSAILEEVSGDYYEEVYKFLLLTGVRIGELAALQWKDIDFKKKQIYICRSMSTSYINGVKHEVISTPKTAHSFRMIPFFEGTEECLRSWEKKQSRYKLSQGERWRAKPEHGNLVFTTSVGSPVTRYSFSHSLERTMRNINNREISNAIIEHREPKLMEHVHPHAFRHTFATRCFEKGLDPLFIQKIMGHSNYSTTVSYTHILDDVVKREVAKAGSFFLE